MNAGYISFIVVSMIVLLLSTGWKEVVIGESAEDGALPAKVEKAPFLTAANSVGFIMLFCIVWILGLFFTLKFHSAVWISGAYLPTIGVALFGLWRSGSLYNAMHIGSTAMLCGAVDVFYKQLLRLEPAMMLYSPVFDVSILIAGITAWMVRGILAQIASLTIGLTLGYGLFIVVTEAPLPYMLGSLRFFDQWWLVLLMTRVLSFLAVMCKRIWKAARR